MNRRRLRAPEHPEKSAVTSVTVTLVGLAAVKGGSRAVPKVKVGCLEFMIFGQEWIPQTWGRIVMPGILQLELILCHLGLFLIEEFDVLNVQYF